MDSVRLLICHKYEFKKKKNVKKKTDKYKKCYYVSSNFVLQYQLRNVAISCYAFCFKYLKNDNITIFFFLVSEKLI